MILLAVKNFSNAKIPKFDDVTACKEHILGLQIWNKNWHLTLALLAEPQYLCLCKQCRSRSVVDINTDTEWQSGLSNLIGWQLEVGMAA